MVVPTGRPDLNESDILGNKAECKLATSKAPNVPGQFPVSATDGSNQTTWRPNTPLPAALDVDLGEETEFEHISLNWAKWPPLKWSFLASNDMGEDKRWSVLHKANKVEISDPWKANDVLRVQMRVGNTTNVKLKSRTKARWVRLVVEGDRSGKGKGATVARVAVL